MSARHKCMWLARRLSETSFNRSDEVAFLVGVSRLFQSLIVERKNDVSNEHTLVNGISNF